ncbi:hypothetical protein D0Z07_8890 [Hyphodiscus hymeniophilus]|uniref:Uncharacterized protein n=1 Tax=Hyphodiscus hymeniophilus TaxID=353542 RepID=A0A9P6SLH2_9HELO|nr:hypothetical protein D0Z07_8890 [Hyphodiscus hymeniophilus]
MSRERASSRDAEKHLKHQHTGSSDFGKAIIPMWDSSDPERAPPPLPMNPSSPSVAASRPNTSSAIQSAHAALTEKARENGYMTNTVAKRIDTSPERSLVKGAAHKRMQSLHTGNVRDLSLFIEGGSSFGAPKSPEKTSNKPGTPLTIKDFNIENRSLEQDRSMTPTPSRENERRDSLNVRPSLRRPPQSILGENTPPQSATMLALQNMASRDMDMPLSNATNGSTALVRTPQTFDAISNQILSLTSIATSLQREMAQLSRRSKDNATDLVSLKEATNARDEDIRQSLRELVVNLSEPASRASSDLYGGGGLYLDSKAHILPGSKAVKPFQLPRIPSPNSFAASLDRDSVSSPSVYTHDSAASIALLEKILREMGTKEGQDQLVSRLTEVADRLARDGMSTAKKLEDLVDFIRDNTRTQGLVAHNDGGGRNGRLRDFSLEEAPRLELDFDKPASGPMTQRVEALLKSSANKENVASPSSRARDVLGEDVINIIRTVKDSVAQGGGLTAEVKALVRELRGEVLGMGREIGRKLDQSNSKDTARDVDIQKEHVARVVGDGLEELKQHMERILRENRRESSSSTVSRNTVDYQEIYNAVRAAVNEQSKSKSPDLEKEDIIEAVREAWENYKPDIELQHFGLEREELLACLKEGIQEYAPQDSTRSIGASREEVFQAVIEGLKHFSPPQIETEASLSREEICDAVRDCLEEFEFPSAPRPEPRESEITRDDMVGAVREGLSNFDFAANTTAMSRDVTGGLSRDDLFDAVKAGLQDAPIPMDAFGEQVLGKLQEIMESMRIEFQAVSDEAKQNVAAHGRDTEQVLDATKDGFEKLRADIESYVDRAADITGKDEILEIMRESFDALRAEVENLVSKGSTASFESVQSQFENLRETMAMSIVPAGVNNDEILDALRDGLDSLRADIEQPRGSNESVLSGTGEILDALHDGLNSLRAEVEKISNKPVDPVDMTVNYEILDTLKAGLESVRADIDRLRENGIGDRAIASITEGAVITAESLKRNDIENLEVLITQLRIKVEALESMPPPPAQPVSGSLSKDDLINVEDLLRNVQEAVAAMSSHDRAPNDDAATKEDVVAIETLLRNTKAKIDEMDPEQAIKKDHLDSVEAIVIETQSSINELATHMDDVSKREDVNIIESLVREVVIGLEEMKERAVNESEDLEKVTKTDVEAVEALCHDVKTAIEQMVLSDLAGLASKDDVKNLGAMVKEFKDRIEIHADANVKAFEERQAETVGVGERVTEVKSFLEEFRDAIKEKLDEGNTGVEALGKLLEGVGDSISNNASITDDVKQLSELLKTEFEKSNAGVVGMKLESDEKFLQTWDKFDGKIDEKFDELMAKYDDAQLSAEAKTKLGEEKSAETEAALLGTKAVAEDLKLLVDSLSTTLTESVERTDEASKTVFNRIDDTFTRVEETHADAKAEHQLTREQVFKTIGAIEGVQNHVAEYHPKILESIKDVLLIVGQHYDHSKTSTTTIQEKIAGIPPPLPVPETPLLRDIPVPEKYDDAQVHEKLDKLVDHMHVAGKSFAQLDMLDKIHEQVMQTAAEVSEFVSAQTKRIADDHEDREKAVEAATIALEKRIAQKEGVETIVVGLREEEDLLKESVSILKAEQEELAHQKMRLSADVSSLETALRIRREELHAMEARAEGLERRILEGVIDHSRALLISKANKGRDAMSRKRVPSHATSTTGSVVSNATSRASVSTQSAVNMAMSGNRAMVSVPINNPAGASRRILSLNQITHNVPTGNFKRSHSVKTSGGSGALRKSSWGGSLSRKYGDLNKENLALKESEEDEIDGDHDLSDGEINRRESRGTTILTGTGASESIDEGTEWTQSGSEDGGEHHEVHAPVVLFEEAGEVA